MDFANIIQTIAIFAIPVLFAITVHEAAHGYVARHFGDNTAAMMGRVTLNPIRHIDPVGTILMPLLLYLGTGGAFVFGYAKPVPVNFGRLRNPRWDTLWVALAGPGSNLLQALLWGAVAALFFGVGLIPLLTGNYNLSADDAALAERFLLGMCRAGVLVNCVMAVFNLFPLPPLDGGRVLTSLLPAGPSHALSRLEPWGFFIVMALVISGVVSKLWMLPLMNVTFTFLSTLLAPLAALAG